MKNRNNKKAQTGFEPVIFGLRDRRLTTWPLRQMVFSLFPLLKIRILRSDEANESSTQGMRRGARVTFVLGVSDLEDTYSKI